MSEYQFPYQKQLRDNGEIIPNTDHNKQEYQVDWLTEAVGDYNLTDGTIVYRLSTLETTPPIESLDDVPDVNIPSPSDGQVLTYNSGIWIAADVAARQ